MEQRLIKIVGYMMPEEAEIAKIALESEGIAAYTEGETTVGMLWYWENAVGGVKLLVAESDVERAIAILAKGHVKEEDGGGSRRACPKCGATLPRGFCVCWSCGAELDDEESLPAPSQGDANAQPAPSQPAADETDEQDAVTAVGDATAWRALAAAIIGVFLCPPLLTLYSVWILLTIGFQNPPMSRRGTRNFFLAVCVDGVVICLVAWYLRFVLH